MYTYMYTHSQLQVFENTLRHITQVLLVVPHGSDYIHHNYDDVIGGKVRH